MKSFKIIQIELSNMINLIFFYQTLDLIELNDLNSN